MFAFKQPLAPQETVSRHALMCVLGLTVLCVVGCAVGSPRAHVDAMIYEFTNRVGVGRQQFDLEQMIREATGQSRRHTNKIQTELVVAPSIAEYVMPIFVLPPLPSVPVRVPLLAPELPPALPRVEPRVRLQVVPPALPGATQIAEHMALENVAAGFFVPW